MFIAGTVVCVALVVVGVISYIWAGDAGTKVARARAEARVRQTSTEEETAAEKAE